ncbi:hypothetical protein [Pseudomonas sp. GM30]|nr:hypothetical protein [Pseudomonas sp. GM30]
MDDFRTGKLHAFVIVEKYQIAYRHFTHNPSRIRLQAQMGV